MTLHSAVLRDSLEEVERLILRGINVNRLDYGGMTALHYAARSNSRVQIAAKLLEYGASMVADKQRRTPLSAACYHNSYDVVALMVSHESCSINHRDINGQTPLHIACARGHSKVVKILLDAGACTNIVDSSHETALFQAVRRDHIEVTEMLINAGADVFFIDSHEDTLLHVICSSSFREHFDLLLDQFAAKNQLNLKNRFGCTPLMIAACNIDFYLIEKLIDHGSDTSLTNNFDLLALHMLGTRPYNNDGLSFDHVRDDNWHKCFELLLANTPVDAIEQYSRYSPDFDMKFDRSLPCFLIRKNSFEGLSLLFDLKLSRDVLMCPVNHKGTLFSPISYLLIELSIWANDDNSLNKLDLLLSKEELVDPLYLGNGEKYPVISTLEAAIRTFKPFDCLVQLRDSGLFQPFHEDREICKDILTRILKKGANPDYHAENRLPRVFAYALHKMYTDVLQILLGYSRLHSEDLVMMLIIMARLSKEDETLIIEFFLSDCPKALVSSPTSTPYRHRCIYHRKLEDADKMRKIKKALIADILKFDNIKVPSLQRIARKAIWKQVWKQSGPKFLDNLKLLNLPKPLVKFVTSHEYDNEVMGFERSY